MRGTRRGGQRSRGPRLGLLGAGTHPRARRGAMLLAAAVGTGCGQADPMVEDDDAPPPVQEPVTTADELLSLETLPSLHISLNASALAALEASPKEWVTGRFEYGGEVYEGVGIRLKGNHSFRPIDEKPSFKIRFNPYGTGQQFLGLEELTLNSMVVDASMLREWVSYRIFRGLGVPAPRAGYAQVTVNEEDYGLYLTLEPYDERFLARVYGEPIGSLYESDAGADLDRSVDSWDQDAGADKSRDDLLAFSELALRDDASVFYEEAAVDLPRFLAFMAAETIVGHFDGHIGGHNFYIYYDPSEDRWTYQPWGLDQAMFRRSTPYEHEGFLGHKCLHDPRCLVDYVLASQQALDAYAAIDLQAEIDRAVELTDAAMRADPRKPFSAESVQTGRDNVRAYTGGRVEELRPQLDCLVDGAQPDADGDGYGPCFQDCDEGDPGINPDAVEACDGVDNDCSGFADDVPECECPSIVSGGRTFWLCRNRITWREARSFCEAQGRVLARFETPEQTAEVSAAADEIDGSRWAIGLNDLEQEADFRWQDGSAPGFSAWADGEPAQQLDWFDCVFLRGGAWYELNCIEKGSFICTDD